MNATEARRLTDTSIAQINVSRPLAAVEQMICAAAKSHKTYVRIDLDGMNGIRTAAELHALIAALKSKGFDVHPIIEPKRFEWGLKDDSGKRLFHISW